MKRVLITGGCGFMGHHLVNHIMVNTSWEVVVLDKLTYAAEGFDRLRDIDCFDEKRVSILTADFSGPISPGVAREIGQVDYVFHLGAETHVDKSIDDPGPFVLANVVGTMHLLNYVRAMNEQPVFFYFSTDEVFGPAPMGVKYKEGDRYNSTNPYAATKAGAEELCLAYANTYRMSVVITHCMNIFGERQHPEKFIPGVIKKVLKGDRVIIHADSTKKVPGSRFYIHARNVASGLLFLVSKGIDSGKWNIVGEKEVDNLEVAQFVARTLKKPLDYVMVDFHSSRPGHDLRYALDGTKMKKLGWQVPCTFEESLKKTIGWFIRSPRWLGVL